MEGKMPKVKEDQEQGQKLYTAAIRKRSDKTSLGIIESEYLLSCEVDSRQAYQHMAILQHIDLFIAIVTTVLIQMVK